MLERLNHAAGLLGDSLGLISAVALTILSPTV
jgi:hypothetical protein